MKSRDVKSFQTIHLCFRKSPKAIFSCISVCDRPGKWPKSDHCDLSQETDPHLIPRVHSDTPVCKHAFRGVVINPLDTLRLQPSPNGYICGSKFMFLLSRKSRKESGWGSESGFFFHCQFPPPLPPVFRGSGRSDPSLGKTAARWI